MARRRAWLQVTLTARSRRLGCRGEPHAPGLTMSRSGSGTSGRGASWRNACRRWIGSYVSLDIPGIGPVEAQIRWQIGFKMGGMFLDPISLGRCVNGPREKRQGQRTGLKSLPFARSGRTGVLADHPGRLGRFAADDDRLVRTGSWEGCFAAHPGGSGPRLAPLTARRAGRSAQRPKAAPRPARGARARGESASDFHAFHLTSFR